MRIYPITRKVRAAETDIVWTEDLSLPDKPAPVVTMPGETVGVSETQRQNPLALQSAPKFTSSREVPAIDAAYPEDLSLPDFVLGTADLIDVSRTASPDTDMLGDCWLDGVALNQGVNHGNESPVFAASEDILATTRRALFEWDLTRFANLDAKVGSTMMVHFWTDHAVAILQTYTVVFSGFAARPFTESTANWTNSNALNGSDDVSKGGSALVRLDILTPQWQQSDITLTAAEFEPFLGRFMLAFVTSNSLIATPLQFTSREHVPGGPAGGQRPRLSFGFEQD